MSVIDEDIDNKVPNESTPVVDVDHQVEHPQTRPNSPTGEIHFAPEVIPLVPATKARSESLSRSDLHNKEKVLRLYEDPGPDGDNYDDIDHFRGGHVVLSRRSMNRSRHSVNFNNSTIHNMTRSNTRINSRSNYDIRRMRYKSTNLSHMQLYSPDATDSEEDELNNNYISLDDDEDDGVEDVINPEETVDGRVSPLVVIQEPDPRFRKRTESFAGIASWNQRRESRYFPGRIRKRVILKNGNVNLSPEHVDKRSRRYLQDMFTTMVDIRWRWNLLVFSMGFFLSWFGFAIIWWLIAFSHSDFDHLGDESWTPCVMNINSFASTLLFSVETQHTIGLLIFGNLL